MSDSVRAERRGQVLEVTLDRPKVNAIDVETSRQLGEAFVLLRDEPDLRVGIVTAAGDRVFSAGWDIKAAHGGGEVGRWWEIDYGPGKFAGLTELWDINKPVIAAINGHALGGGLELALACDLLIAADHAEFAMPELPIGILPDSGGIQRLPRRLPHNIAMELLLLGERMSARDARHYGLLNAVVPNVNLMATARAWADKIAAGAPLTIQALKEALKAIDGRGIREGFDIIRSGKLPAYERAIHSEDAKEGVRAFSEKRPAVFKGR
ncbi:MAG: enoyl-CoA hydratase-related protein [Dongiaceae bacterium]